MVLLFKQENRIETSYVSLKWKFLKQKRSLEEFKREHCLSVGKRRRHQIELNKINGVQWLLFGALKFINRWRLKLSCWNWPKQNRNKFESFTLHKWQNQVLVISWYKTRLTLCKKVILCKQRTKDIKFSRISLTIEKSLIGW